VQFLRIALLACSNPPRAQIAGEIFDTLDRLNEIGQHLKHCLTRNKIFTDSHSVTGPLRSSLVDFYAHIIQFSITASQIYRKRKISAISPPEFDTSPC
jgi:hypothetical protein